MTRGGCRRVRRKGAFSLLELMIALAIVAVVTAYAMPAYRAYAARGYRMDAMLTLYRAAHFIETARPARTAHGAADTLPAGLDRVPPQGPAVYRLHLQPADAGNGGYAIEAVPSAGGLMAGDRCGTFVLEATGRRANRVSGVSALEIEDCWRAR
ncbi:type IV pilin protein [Trinickia caryophylli]|nr:type IV pilin protein [Trinickia caryophylli]